MLSDAELAQRLRTVKLLTLDVDGVLTDGGLYFTEDGSQMRRFNVRDGEGMKQVMAAGVQMALITASATQAIAHRARVLGIEHALIGVSDKLTALKGLCEILKIDIADVAHMGDDLNDLPTLQAVGLSLTVADARPEVLAEVDFASAQNGGDAAVRDICDRLVAARNS